MKPWLDLAKVPMPKRIALLPKDERGYPVPSSVWHGADGKPDFRVLDPEKWLRHVRAKRCGVCGAALERTMAFVGGPMSIFNRTFTDLAMHPDCAHYAMQVCPMLAAPSFAYARTNPEGTETLENVSTRRPDQFGLGLTSGYDLVLMQPETFALKAKPFKKITWWKHGQELTDKAVVT